MEEIQNANDPTEPLVLAERQGHSVWLMLNRPEAANALSRALGAQGVTLVASTLLYSAL